MRKANPKLLGGRGGLKVIELSMIASLVDQPVIHYGDFAVWERNHLNQATRRYKEQVGWWAPLDCWQWHPRVTGARCVPFLHCAMALWWFSPHSIPGSGVGPPYSCWLAYR